jgi:SAM-dependent methyltransferase
MGSDSAPVWRLLTEPRTPGTDGYFEHVRHELLDMFEGPPRLFVDMGCGTGATAAEAKRRFPGVTVVGFELSATAAAVAQRRLDRVVQGDLEGVDFAQLGFAPGSIDGLLLADVLEHLYNPWQLLSKLRPYLAPAAQVVASIPNARNLVLLSELAGGTFRYEEAGLLDVTHIRFFTKADMLAMFAQTGYVVRSVLRCDDGRIPPFPEVALPTDLSAGSLTLRALDAQALEELRTIQFYLKATPAPGSGSAM